MNPKPRPNHQRYLEVLRSLSPEQRLLKAFELAAFAKGLFLDGLRRRFPEKTDREIRAIYLARLHRCHNRNY